MTIKYIEMVQPIADENGMATPYFEDYLASLIDSLGGEGSTSAADNEHILSAISTARSLKKRLIESLNQDIAPSHIRRQLNYKARIDDLSECQAQVTQPKSAFAKSTFLESSFRPKSSESASLGVSGFQWSAVYVGNGTDMTAGTSATINKSCGRFRISSGSTSFTLTNSYIAATDVVICQPCQNDATGRVNSVVPSGGSAVIYCTAPTSNMDIQFLVIKA